MAPEEKGAQVLHPDTSRGSAVRNDDREQTVARLWKKNGISAGAVARYLQWVRPFRDYCQRRGPEETSQLTLEEVRRFLHVVGPRTKGPIAPASCHVARNALHAWALGALRIPVPEWRPPRASAKLTPLLAAYCAYRRAHCGIAESTLQRDIWTTKVFLALLSAGSKSVSKTSVADLDRFVSHLSARVSRQSHVVVFLCEHSCDFSTPPTGYAATWPVMLCRLASGGPNNRPGHFRGRTYAASSERFGKKSHRASVISPCCC